MLEANVDRVLERIARRAQVLDVGGGALPFNRADWVVDLLPYEARGRFGSQGPPTERFTRDSWVQMDVCRGRLPFEDGRFDFVICSHTLEDVRDPVHLCEEIVRVGRAGYLETPSKLAELAFGIESRRYAGYCHHRWLVEMCDREVVFEHKPHLVHGSWRFHLPKRVARRSSPASRVAWMFWTDTFEAREQVWDDRDEIEASVGSFVRDQGAYPPLRYAMIPLVERLGRVRATLGSLRAAPPAP